MLAVSTVGLTQAQIASHLKKSVNEIYRILNTLKERGYLELDEVTDQYKLSYKLLTLASTFSPTKSLLEKANPIMKEIAAKTNQSVHLSIYTTGKLLVIAQQDSGHDYNYHVSVGRTFDLLETSSGRVILTFQSEQERKRRLHRRKLFLKIEDTFVMPKKKLKEIEKKYSKQTTHRIKKDGYEIVKSLAIQGITNIPFSVFDNSGYAIAAITTPFLNRFNEKNQLSIDQTAKILETYSSTLSKQLGYSS